MNELCSIELLQIAVARGLSADEEAALHAHLEHCEACCAQMEQLAGGEAWQQEAAALLSADELDAAVPEPANWSEVDFSVEHLDPSDDANVLGQLGGYDVLAIVGRGGMGVVLKAFDRELKRLVAIKALAPHLAHSSVARKRFAREAQAAAAVVNPHVIAIHHVQPTGRLPFLIMPLLTGESLAQRLKARGPLELTEVLRIGMQAAAGLAAAHDQGLVHRDVKPANIFLEKGVERVVITDFGLARAADDVSMTSMGVVAGTPEYMSPEQARGEALDGRSDLFSLGCVLYEMATGVSPFRTDSTMATLRRIVDEQPAAMASLVPEVPPWFSHIVERLLSKDPAQRFASASEVSQLLEQCLSHLQQPTSVPLPASLVPHATGRRSIFTVTWKGVLAMLGTIGMTLLGMVLFQATEAPDISGQWTSDEWGTVVLEAKGSGKYEGTFSGANKGESTLGGGGGVDSSGRGSSSTTPAGAGGVLPSSSGTSPIIGPTKANPLLGGSEGIDPAGRVASSTMPAGAGGVLPGSTGPSPGTDKGQSTLGGSDSAPRISNSTMPAGAAGVMPGSTGASPGKAKSGTLQLKWSRVERRFNGTWGTGDDRRGKISLRLVDNEIRGAWTTGKDAQKESDTTRLGDLLWRRSRDTASTSNVPSIGSTAAEPSSRDEKKLLVRKSETSVKVEGHFDGNEEVLLVIGDPKTPAERKGKKELHWPVPLEKAGDYIFEVRRDMLKLDDGGTAPGLVFQVHGPPTTLNENPSNITVVGKYMQPDGKVVLASPKDELLLIRKTDQVLVVVGEVEYPDASTLPVHIVIRRKARVNLPSRVEEPKAAVPLDVRSYVIQDLPLWSRDGSSQHIDLLIHYLEARVDSTKNGGDKIGSYDAGRGVLVVRGDARKHQQIAQLLTELRASSGQPADDLAKEQSLKTYSIADLPIWSKDGKKQSVDLLLSYLRSNVDPPSWESKATRAAYQPGTLSLVVQGTEEVHNGIKAALSRIPKRVLNVSQVMKEGRALNESEEIVVVRFQVADARIEKFSSEKDVWENWWVLSSEKAPYESHPLSFRVNVTTKVLDELKKKGIEDIAKHFVGKVLEVEGPVMAMAGAISPLMEERWFQLDIPNDHVEYPSYSTNVYNLQQIQEAKAVSPPMIDGAKTLNRENIRSVIGVYVAAALQGDHTTAASVAIVQGKPADPKQIEPQIQAISRSLNLKQLAMPSIYLNDWEHPTGALAISESVTHAEKQRNGERTGFVMLELLKFEESWFVTGVEFRTKDAADKELKRFIEANPKSIDLPPQAAREAAKSATGLAESPPQTQSAMPTRVNDFTTARSTKIACSADGKLIAIAHGGKSSPVVEGWNRSVEILQAETGESVAVLPTTTTDEEDILAATEGLSHLDVGPLAFSPDGALLAVGTSLGQVKLFEARSGKLVKLVLALDDEPAKLAEQKTPKELKSLKRAMGSVRSLAFSPDGTRLAMCGSSFEDAARHWGGVERLGELVTGPGRLKVWDVKSGALIHDLAGHSHVDAVSYSADGNLLASAGRWNGDDSGTGVIIWDAKTGKQLRTITNQANGGTHAVVFSPTGNVVAIGSRQFDKTNDTSTTTVSLTHAMSGITEWQQTMPGWAKPGGFSPDGKSLVVLCGGESIRLFDTETGAVKREIRSADSPQGGRWYDFALPPHGRRMAIGGVISEEKGTVEIWSQENQVKENRSAVAKAQEQEKKTVEDKTVPVAGAILQLNTPGTILIEVSIGSDDGLKTGDVFVVSRKDKRIGKLTITKCEPDRSTAKIIVVNDGETLQIGDQFANRSASVEIWSQENQVKENRPAVAKAQEQEKKNVEDKNVPVAGAILQLNKPGTILIEISIGSDDGLKTGDVLVVSRKDKRIGTLTITKCEPDRSTAKIIVVNDGETLQIGDQVANRSASLGAARPPRKMQNKH